MNSYIKGLLRIGGFILGFLFVAIGLPVAASIEPTFPNILLWLLVAADFGVGFGLMSIAITGKTE